MSSHLVGNIFSANTSDETSQNSKTASTEDLLTWDSPRQYQSPTPPLSASGRVNLPPSQVPCRWYNAGYCARGESCWYLHEKTNVKLRPLKLQNGSSMGTECEDADLSPMQLRWRENVKKAKDEEKKEKMRDKGKGPENKMKVDEDGEGVEDGESSDCVTIPEVSTENCSICFEVPQTYGLLSGCDHIFCLECIRKWREPNLTKHPWDDDEHVDQRVNQKRCPICRVPSQFVIPSSVFPTPPLGHSKNIEKREGAADEENPPLDPNPAKAIIIANFLTKMKTIPCRYFAKPKKYISLDRLGDVVTCNETSNSPGKGTRKHPRRIPLCRHGNDCHYRHFHPEYPGADYFYTEKELAVIERNNKTEKDRKRHQSWASLFGGSSSLRRRARASARNMGLEWEDGDLGRMMDVLEVMGFDVRVDMDDLEDHWGNHNYEDDYDPDWDYDYNSNDEDDDDDDDELEDEYAGEEWDDYAI